MKNKSIRELIETILENTIEQDRMIAAKTISQLAQEIQRPLDFQAFILKLSKGLKDENDDIQFHVAHSLVTLAERGVDIQEALAELVQCLEAPTAINVQKEAVWSIVCIIYAGGDIRLAVPMLDNNISNGTQIKGNSTVALALYYLRNNGEAEVRNLLAMEDGHIRFAIAYAAATFAVTDHISSPLEEVLAKIHFGLSDRDLITGVAAALIWLKDLEENINPAMDIIRQKAKEAELVRQAAINGIFFHMHKN